MPYLEEIDPSETSGDRGKAGVRCNLGGEEKGVVAGHSESFD